MRAPRITTGLYKGRNLKVPASARPITDKVKLSLFNILSGTIKGASFLDLFAGSGNVGIEALSRGAKHVTFVELDADAVDTIQLNLDTLSVPDNQYRVLKTRFEQFIYANNDTFDVIYVDPPFALLSGVDYHSISKAMHEESILIIKFDKKAYDNSKIRGFTLLDERDYGTNKLLFLRA